MSLSIQERLKDLRVERGLTLGQLAEQTGLSKSALGSYETEDFKDISHYALIKLAKFYGVTADYLLGLMETKNHPNADLADLRLSDEMIDLLKGGRIDTVLLCELTEHTDFVKLLADIQIYVEGIAATQIQNLNAWVDVARAEILEKYQPGEHDKTARVLQAAHVREGDYFSSRAEQLLMVFCKQTKLRYSKLTEEEKQWLTRIVQKSELAKSYLLQRGKRK